MPRLGGQEKPPAEPPAARPGAPEEADSPPFDAKGAGIKAETWGPVFSALGYRLDPESGRILNGEGRPMSDAEARRAFGLYDLAADRATNPLDNALRQNLAFMGYRVDEASGRILRPDGTPVTRLELAYIRSEIRLQNKTLAVERAHLLLAKLPADAKLGAAELAALKTVIERGGEDLPADLKGLLERAGDMTAGELKARFADSLTGLARLYDGRLSDQDLVSFVTTPPARAPPDPGYFDDKEARLGRALTASFQSELEATPTGRALLARFKRDGEIRLPRLAIVRTTDGRGTASEEFGAAYYNHSRDEVLFRFATVKAILLRATPEADRPALEAQLETDGDLRAYLAGNEEARKRFAADAAVMYVHELTHAWQARRQPVWQESLRYTAVMDSLKIEHEAFMTQNAYLYDVLLRDPQRALADPYLPSLESMLVDFTAFRKAISESYLAGDPIATQSFVTAQEIQDQRLRFSLAATGPWLSNLWRKGLLWASAGRGSSAMRAADVDSDFQIARFQNGPLVEMRRKGLPALGDAYLQAGRPREALAAYTAAMDSLLEIPREGSGLRGFVELAGRFTTAGFGMQAAAEQTLLRFKSPPAGQHYFNRVHDLNALSGYFQGRGAASPLRRAFDEALPPTYADMAGQALDAAAAEPAQRADHLGLARSFISALPEDDPRRTGLQKRLDAFATGMESQGRSP